MQKNATSDIAIVDLIVFKEEEAKMHRDESIDSDPNPVLLNAGYETEKSFLRNPESEFEKISW